MSRLRVFDVGTRRRSIFCVSAYRRHMSRLMCQHGFCPTMSRHRFQVACVTPSNHAPVLLLRRHRVLLEPSSVCRATVHPFCRYSIMIVVGDSSSPITSRRSVSNAHGINASNDSGQNDIRYMGDSGDIDDIMYGMGKGPRGIPQTPPTGSYVQIFGSTNCSMWSSAGRPDEQGRRRGERLGRSAALIGTYFC
ncbi:hypothetical protein BDV97DRAFT_405856 [Delphinella strobiligena]|nr:hypothetical protein BDV97DRAFT_405856 [Delphinella strobiligena]